MEVSSSNAPKPSSSNALIRKSTDTELMPPPPLKRIKRPPKVLDEDTYTDALSEIIARDFFPGLLETKYQQEYLDAITSRDPEWIAKASRKLTEVMNTPQHRRRGTSFVTPRFRNGSATPAAAGSTPGAGSTATPGSTAPTKTKKPALDTSLSLDSFQSKYTSEDNESFNRILDKQNEKRRGAYAFLWNGNRIPGFRTKAHKLRLKAQQEEKERSGGQELIVAPDDRPAIPNTWKAEPRNGLMFVPDGSPPPPEPSEDGGGRELPPKAVVYASTRMPPPAPIQDRPSSPTSSAIGDAIAGKPRPTASEKSPEYPFVETPRVRGYRFLDVEPSPSPDSLGPPPLTWGSVEAISDATTTPTTTTTTTAAAAATTATTTPVAPSPFKLAATPRRELLHHRMVEKVAKNKRLSSQLPGAVASPRMTPLGGGGKGREIPKFGSSPAVTPAGQRLWGDLSARRETTGLRETVLGKGKGSAALQRGRGFRWTATPKAK